MRAVCELSDLIVAVEFVQTHGAAALRRRLKLRELHHRQHLSDQDRARRLEFGQSGRVKIRVLLRIPEVMNVRFEEIGEAHGAKEERCDCSEESKYGKDLDEKLRENELGATHRKSHIREPERMYK